MPNINKCLPIVVDKQGGENDFVPDFRSHPQYSETKVCCLLSYNLILLFLEENLFGKNISCSPLLCTSGTLMDDPCPYHHVSCVL